MIETLEIKNYQSHVDTKMELAPLTVLIGPSNVGKSAFIRALKALASNQTGKDFITHGEQTMQVKATTDKGTIVLTKGKPEDSYVLLESGNEQNPRRYTKLGVGVPDDVTAFLGIDPKDAINFAGQFDMPYLLRTSAAEVARVLGELTNVSSLFEASREATRRRNAFNATLKTRESDLATLEPKLEEEDDVVFKLTVLDDADYHAQGAQRAQVALSRLDDLVMTLRTANARLKAAQGATEAPLPDIAAAKDAYNLLASLNDIISSLSVASAAKKAALVNIEACNDLISTTEAEYDAALQEAGTCPTCHQSTEGIHTHVHA